MKHPVLIGVPCGFPSPAEDYLHRGIDLNQQLIRHPASTFFVRVKGHSMKEAGISDGDMLVVDRAMPALSGSVIVAVLNGGFTVKRFQRKGKRYYLSPAHPSYSPIEIKDKDQFEVWGVVTYVVHPPRSV